MMRQRLTGLVAVLVIVVLLLGIPAGLWLVAGPPWPHSVSWDGLVSALTSPDDGTAFLAVVRVLGWLAWVSFAAMVLLEVLGRVRGITVPQLRGLGLQQAAAAGLVGAALLLFVGVFTTATPAPADAHTTTSSTTTSSTTAASSAVTASAAADTQTHEATQETTTPARAPAMTTYTVRSGDTLWRIAQSQLGDGSRFPEIARANYGVTQPDGGALTSEHWLTPGWRLQIPAKDVQDSPRRGSVVVQPGDTLSAIAQDKLGDAAKYPELVEATENVAQPGGVHLEDPDRILPGWTINIPNPTNPPPAAGAGSSGSVADPQRGSGDASPAKQRAHDRPQAGNDGHSDLQSPADAGAVQGQAKPEGTGGAATRVPNGGSTDGRQTSGGAGTQAAAQVGDAEQDGVSVRTVGGIGMILAAGVLGLILTRRRRQLLRRRPGQELPMPSGPAEAAEQEIRVTADPLSVETVDLALRTLSHRLAQKGQPLPVVRAARLTADQFDLYLAEPATLPGPWTATAGTNEAVWSLPAAAVDVGVLLPPLDAEQVPAPYPSLVTIGHDDEDGCVFVDLEFLGTLAVTGDHDQTRQTLAAIAVELATSTWADDLQLTFVGGYSELQAALDTGRVRYIPVLGTLLEELERRADEDRAALREQGGDLNSARAAGILPGAWTPEIVLVVGHLDEAQRDQLRHLVDQLPRVAIAAVTTGAPIGDWAITLDGPQSGVLAPIGLPLRPQQLDDATYGQILTVLAIADEESPPAGEWQNIAEPRLSDLPSPAPDQAQYQETNTDATTPPVGDTGTPLGHDVDSLSDLEPSSTRESASVESPADRPDTDDAEENTPENAASAAGVRPGPESAARPEAAASQDTSEAVVPVVAAAPETTSQDRARERRMSPDDATPSDQGETRVAHLSPGVRDVLADITTPDDGDDEAAVVLLPARSGPRVLLLGRVEVTHTAGQPCETSKRGQLTELAAFLITSPGCDATGIDAALWPGQVVSDNTRNPAVSKLRRWLGSPESGGEFLPRYQSGEGYRLSGEVTSDWDDWQQLLPEGAQRASTQALRQALDLVRGTPIDADVRRHNTRLRYTWAETLRQRMITAIVDASYELARRYLTEGRWRQAEQAAVVGIGVEPGLERLWRIRLLAAYASGNPEGVEYATQKLYAAAELLNGDLEDQTVELLEQIHDSGPIGHNQLAGAR